MSISDKFENVEAADIDEFLEECDQKAQELGINLEYYLEEFL